jgi:hypothetical protein
MANAMDIEKQLVEFYGGAHMLDMIASWAYVVANSQTILERVASFEKAYEDLIGLHATGKLGGGEADFSVENLERVKALRRLIQLGFDSVESRQGAPEIHALAERCVRGLKQPAP